MTDSAGRLSPPNWEPPFERRYAGRKFNNFAPLYFPVGTRSKDNQVVLGEDGFVFLLLGSNKLIDLYAMDRHVADQYKNKWVSLISDRNRQISLRNMSHYSFFIPEKSTILDDKFPYKIIAPTKILSDIEELSNDLNVIPLREMLRTHKHRTFLFPKTDSHLSVLGSLLLFRHLLARCFPELDTTGLLSVVDPSSIASEREVRAGSLAPWLFDAPVYEEYLVLRPNAFAEFNGSKLVDDVDAPSGKFVGARRVSAENSDAPLKAKVVVFGNSFFERGSSPQGLSWWFKTFFSEFHFLWKPEVDYAYLDSVQPNYVIFQSIERFMTVVPSA